MLEEVLFCDESGQTELKMGLPHSNNISCSSIDLGCVSTEGDLILDPRLIEHFPKENIKSNGAAVQAVTAPRVNLGIFSAVLYQGIFRGGEYKFEPPKRHKLLTGEVVEFSPDLVEKDLFGSRRIELKATCKNGNKFMCHNEQISSYFYKVLKDARDDARPVPRYALFRYGKSRKNYKLFQMNEKEAILTVGMNMKDCVVVAPNQLIMLLILASTSYKPRNDMSTGEITYLSILGTTIDYLLDERSVDPNWFLDAYEKTYMGNLEVQFKKNHNTRKLKKRKDAFEMARRFANWSTSHLDDLAVEKLTSDKRGRLIYLDKELPCFPVMVYSIKHYGAWLDDFKKYHKIALNSIGVRDLWSLEAPYRRREERRRLSGKVDGVPF